MEAHHAVIIDNRPAIPFARYAPAEAFKDRVRIDNPNVRRIEVYEVFPNHYQDADGNPVQMKGAKAQAPAPSRPRA